MTDAIWPPLLGLGDEVKGRRKGSSLNFVSLQLNGHLGCLSGVKTDSSVWFLGLIPIPSHNVTNEIDGFFRLARA
jgi:hypothetical protein